MLNKVTDRVGKYYTYSYEKDDTNGEIRIKQVDYTGSSFSQRFTQLNSIMETGVMM